MVDNSETAAEHEGKADPRHAAPQPRAVLAISTEGSVRPPGLAFDVPEGTVMPGVPIGSQYPTNEKRS